MEDFVLWEDDFKTLQPLLFIATIRPVTLACYTKPIICLRNLDGRRYVKHMLLKCKTLRIVSTLVFIFPGYTVRPFRLIMKVASNYEWQVAKMDKEMEEIMKYKVFHDH